MAERFYPGASRFCLLEQPIENSGNAALQMKGRKRIVRRTLKRAEKGFNIAERDAAGAQN